MSDELDALLQGLISDKESKEEEKEEKGKVEESEVKKSVTLEDLHAVPPMYTESQKTVSDQTIILKGEESEPKVEPEIKVKVSTVIGSEPPKKVIEGFEIEEEKPVNKYVIMIYGDKGTGKTVTALSFQGELCVLSFDRKAMPIKMSMYNGDKRIHVFDAVKYMDWHPEKVTESSSKTFDYILKVLEYCGEKIKPDWVIIDGTEIMEQIVEFAMRHRHGLGPFQGIANLNVWKERRLMLRQIHNKAYSIAKKGIIYTTYTHYEDIVIEGELVTRKEVPKWIDVIMFETDAVLKTEYNSRDRVFSVKVVTSKIKELPTGNVYGVTNKPLGTQINL